MRLTGVRFTVRRMMLAVLLTALALVTCRFLSEVWADINDTYYFSSRVVEHSWDAGASPEVVVDIFAGRISVVQATNDKVTVRVRPLVTTKKSQAAADFVSSAIQLTMSQEAGAVRVTAVRPPAFSAYRMDIDVELHVPCEARLDLHTRQGDIWVGQAYVGAYLVQSPTAVRSIKARADFDGSDWTYQGDIFVETARRPVGGPVFPVTYLDLEGVRQVEIHSDDALVQARARGGTFTVGYETETGKEYEEHKVEGSLSFVGTLSEGPQSFRAADRVKLLLPAGAAVELDAEASRGTVTSTLPMNAGGIIARSRIQGVVGAAPKASVKVRVDEGSIEIDETF